MKKTAYTIPYSMNNRTYDISRICIDSPVNFAWCVDIVSISVPQREVPYLVKYFIDQYSLPVSIEFSFIPNADPFVYKATANQDKPVIIKTIHLYMNLAMRLFVKALFLLENAIQVITPKAV